MIYQHEGEYQLITRNTTASSPIQIRSICLSLNIPELVWHSPEYILKGNNTTQFDGVGDHLWQGLYISITYGTTLLHLNVVRVCEGEIFS